MFRILLVAFLVAVSPFATAQKYPTRTVEVVVPYAPGGGTDNLMRMITGIIDENKWSPQPLNVVNRAGGSGAIGYNYLINKKGDAHVIAGATPMIVSGKIEGRLPGNHRDAMTTLMIVAIDELTTALMGGHIDAAVENPNEIVAQVEAGKAKNLAVAARKRLADAPDVPTFAEKGYEFYWEQMRGVVGPANMSPEAVKWWLDTLKKVTDTKKWQEQYIKRNLLTPTQWTGEEANKYLDGLHAKYEEAIKGLKAASK